MNEQTTQQTPPEMPADDDVEKNKLVATLAYLVFFLPLLIAKESPYARYHANQGLILFLVALGIYIVGVVIPVFGWFIVLPVGYLVTIIFLLIGMVHAWNGEKKPLPYIGGAAIIKERGNFF